MSKLLRKKHQARHMSMNIAGCLRNVGRKKIRFFDKEDGTAASDKEARAYLNSELLKGNKLVPMGEGCYRFDAKDKGCLGHIISLMPTDEKMESIELEWALFKQGKRL